MKSDIIRSERLRIRQFSKTDAVFLLTLMNSSDWLKMLGNEKVHTVRDAEHYLKHHIIKESSQPPYGFLLFELIENKLPIGLCGITRRNAQTIPDLGFAILPKFAGQDYTFEAASTLLNHIRQLQYIPQIDAFTTLHNIASQKLLEKLGFTFQKELFHVTFQSWVQHYSITL